MENKFKTNIFPKEQKKLFDFICGQAWLEDFYLAGGTALALQIGHRQSVDFDFFKQGSFDNRDIIKNVEKCGSFELFTQGADTIHGALNGVQISFFRLEDKLVSQTLMYGHMRIAGMLDIAAMKLNAISGRGTRKDFVDLYFLLQDFSLVELFKKYELKYGKSASNNYHLLKSLTYFGDAEAQPMPKMFVKIKWDTVKKNIISKVKSSEIICHPRKF